MTVSRFHIAGMDCAAEEQLVRMALSDVSHIDGLEFNLQQRDVLIDHAGDLGAIESALKTLNLGANYVEDVDAIGPPADTRRERNALLVAQMPSIWARTPVFMPSAWPLWAPLLRARNGWRD